MLSYTSQVRSPIQASFYKEEVVNSLQAALQSAKPLLKLVEQTSAHLGRILQDTLNRAHKDFKSVMGPDKITRVVGAIELNETETDAIAWTRQNGAKLMTVQILAIRLKDQSLVYEITHDPTSKVRFIHLAARLRKQECKAQEVFVPTNKLPMLTAKGQPDFRAMRQWSWDPEGTIVIRSIGTSRLPFEDVFNTVANALSENMGIEGQQPRRSSGRDRRLQKIRRNASA